MARNVRGLSMLFVAVVLFIFAGSCAEEKERTRQDDNTIIREMIGRFETWTSDRDAGDFDDKKTEAFDAAAFIDTIWDGVDAERVEFKIRRLRVSAERGRAVIDVLFIRDGVRVQGKFVVVELVFLEERWQADSFQLLSPEDNL